MKKKFMISAMALLGMLTSVSMTSCDGDDNNAKTAKLELSNEEVGHDGEATIGKNIHLECKIYAEAKIKQIEVEMKDAAGKTVLTKRYESGKYAGVLNTTFHEHVDLPATLTEGTYQVAIKVTDMKGQTKSVEARVKLVIKTAEVSVELLDATTHKPITSARPGDKVLVKATARSIVMGKPVTEIELEFHGTDGEHEIDLPDAVLAKYLNKEAFTFEETITVPASCKAGACHFHFTVKADGHENTGEVEDFNIL